MGLTFSSILVHYLQRRNDVINTNKEYKNNTIDIPDIQLNKRVKSQNHSDIIHT